MMSMRVILGKGTMHNVSVLANSMFILIFIVLPFIFQQLSQKPTGEKTLREQMAAVDDIITVSYQKLKTTFNL
jgi:hypothetical protein